MKRALYWRLSSCLLLEMATIACVLPVLAIHMREGLGFNESQMASVYMTMPLASLVSPLIAGWLADRYWSAQKCLAVVDVVRAGAFLAAAQAESYSGFLGAMAVMAVFNWPSLVLSSAVVFHHLEDARDFGRVRVWGAVGWIIMVWAFSFHIDRFPRAEQFARIGDGLLWASALSLMAGLYALTLPPTPPSRNKQTFAMLDAVRLLRHKNFAVLISVAFLFSFCQPFHYVLQGLFFTDQSTGLGLDVAGSNRASSVDQLLEVPLFPLLGILLHRFGLKPVLFFGVAAWTVRFSAYMMGEPAWLVVGAQLLHGVNVVFWMVAVKVAVDMMAHIDVRASAQGLLAVAAGGLGAFTGQLACTAVYAHFELPGGGHAWAHIYAVPLVVSAAASVLLLALYRPEPASQRVVSAGV